MMAYLMTAGYLEEWLNSQKHASNNWSTADLKIGDLWLSYIAYVCGDPVLWSRWFYITLFTHVWSIISLSVIGYQLAKWLVGEFKKDSKEAGEADELKRRGERDSSGGVDGSSAAGVKAEDGE